MKNIIFFVILALLTVIALVSFSTAKNRFGFGTKVANVTPTPKASPTPTPGDGSLGRNGIGFGTQITPTVTPYIPSNVGDTTKGGVPLITPTPAKQATKGGATLGTMTATTPDRPTIFYENAGFRPVPFTVKTGTMVVFKNNSDRQMQVIGDSDARGLDSNFSQRWAVGRNGFFEFQFNTAGTYHFADQFSQHLTGSVVVTN